MKFDLDTAWKDTSRLLRDNFALLVVLAGVFFFVPYAALMLFVPEIAELGQMQADPGSDAMFDAVMAVYTNYWWVFLIVAVVQGIGLLAMLALLRHRDKPTVADAITTGAVSFPSYFIAQLLQSLLLVFVSTLLIGIPLAIGFSVGAFLGVIAAFVAFIYILTKLSMTSPIIAIDGVRNPINALGGSWKLTKGNSLRLFAFYALIFVAFIIASTVFSLIVNFIFALAGPDIMLFGTTIVSSAVNAFFIMLIVCLLAAIHMQLVRLQKTGAPKA